MMFHLGLRLQIPATHCAIRYFMQYFTRDGRTPEDTMEPHLKKIKLSSCHEILVRVPGNVLFHSVEVHMASMLAHTGLHILIVSPSIRKLSFLISLK